MVQVSILSTSIMVSGSITEIELGTLSPWKSLLAANTKPPPGPVDTVEGNIPRVVVETAVSAPVA
jgi:hypothetical protein